MCSLLPEKVFQDVEYHFDNILEKINLQTLHIRRSHFDASFLINVFSGTKNAPLSSKQSAFVFLLGTYVILTRSVIPSATGLQLDMFLLQMQFTNLQTCLVCNI
jgi:hypothetical protein